MYRLDANQRIGVGETVFCLRVAFPRLASGSDFVARFVACVGV
jgi:hypothetical protein